MSNKTGAEAHIDLLGMAVTDRVTGLAGVITSVCFDLYGCIQAVVQPGLDKDGKSQDGRWFDIHRLIIDESKERCMQAPSFNKPEFGATPQTHSHGAAEKPAR